MKDKSKDVSLIAAKKNWGVRVFLVAEDIIVDTVELFSSFYNYSALFIVTIKVVHLVLVMLNGRYKLLVLFMKALLR